MKLLELLKGVEYKSNKNIDVIDINGIAYDSRKVKPGFVFVAIKGYVTDGHDYIESAISNGASAIVLEDDSKIVENKVAYILVENSRKVLSKIADTLYDKPSSKINVIGVTGTNGKSSICHMLNDALIAVDETTGVLGTIGNFIGEKKYPTEVTTPESLEIHSFIKDMVDMDARNLLMEVSSHSLDLYRVEDINYDVCIFTNLTRDHLDFHKSMDGYFKAKKKLFLLSNSKNVINIDDEYGKQLYEELKEASSDVYSYSINEECDFSAKNIVIASNGSNFTFVCKDFECEISIPIPGKIYIYNAIAVLSSMVLLGYDREVIMKASSMIKPVKGRLESVKNDRGISILVDYSHTPDSLKNVLLVAREFTEGKVISVYGCGGNRDKTKRPVMGKISEELADLSIITSDNPRFEDPLDIIEDILAGIDRNREGYLVEVDRRRAIEKAIDMAKSGDSIVIAGKGHENYQIIKDVKYHLDDREIVEDYLKGGKND